MHASIILFLQIDVDGQQEFIGQLLIVLVVLRSVFYAASDFCMYIPFQFHFCNKVLRSCKDFGIMKLFFSICMDTNYQVFI